MSSAVGDRCRGEGGDEGEEWDPVVRIRNVEEVERGVQRMALFIATFLPAMLYIAWRVDGCL